MFEYRRPKKISKRRLRLTPEEKLNRASQRREEKENHRELLIAKRDKERHAAMEKWERQAAPMLAITRSDPFRRWYFNETGFHWLESCEEDPFLAHFDFENNLRAPVFLRLLKQYSTRQQIEKYFTEYDGSPLEPIIKAWQRRMLRLRQATPKWVNWEKIHALELQRDRLNEAAADGELFHLDHVVPLQGAVVCGLHVHTNLQIIPMAENVKKGNRFDPLDIT